jgi:hypothetical protein
MQVKILSRFQEHWNDTYTYIRFRTVTPLLFHYTNIFKQGTFEELDTEEKDDHVYLFPDCQEKHVWEIILSAIGLLAFTRTFFMLDQRPSNWQEVINRLFQSTLALANDNYASEFENDLSNCRCICYSINEDLILEKVDLPENIMLTILEDVAREEGLEIVFKRETAWVGSRIKLL